MFCHCKLFTTLYSYGIHASVLMWLQIFSVITLIRLKLILLCRTLLTVEWCYSKQWSSPVDASNLHSDLLIFLDSLGMKIRKFADDVNTVEARDNYSST